MLAVMFPCFYVFMFGRLFYKGRCTTFEEKWPMGHSRTFCYILHTLAITLILLPSTSCTTFDKIVSVGSYTITFNYMINAWEVKFDEVQLQNSLVIPQLCTADPAQDPTLSTCTQDDITSVVACTQLQTLVNTEVWSSTSLLENAHALCSTTSLR